MRTMDLVTDAEVRHIQRVGFACVRRDISGLNLEERRAVARHVLRNEGVYEPRLVQILTLWPTPLLRKRGFKGKARS